MASPSSPTSCWTTTESATSRRWRTVSNLVVLNVGHNYVDSLRGLDNLTSLATLWVNWQRDRDLVSLDGIENLTSLSTLYASGNAIDDLWPLENLTQLWTVSLSYNEIYNLEPLVGLANLKEPPPR